MNKNKLFQMILLAFVSAAILIFGAECNSAQAMKRGASGFDTDEECVELAKKVDRKDECTVDIVISGANDLDGAHEFEGNVVDEECVEIEKRLPDYTVAASVAVKKEDMDEDLTSIIPSSDVADVGDVRELEEDTTDIAMIEASEVGKVELTKEQVQERIKILEESLEKAILKLKGQKSCLYLTGRCMELLVDDSWTFDGWIEYICKLQLQLDSKEIGVLILSCDFLDRIDTRNVDTFIALCDFFIRNESVYFVADKEPGFKTLSEKDSIKNVNLLDIFKESLPYAENINEGIWLRHIYFICKNDFTGKTVDKIRKYKSNRDILVESGVKVYLSELLTRYLKDSEEDTESFPIIKRDEDGFILYTPFGSVFVNFSEYGDPMVCVENDVIKFEDGKPVADVEYKFYSYNELEVCMDAYLDEYVLQVIYDYLSIRENYLSTIERPSVKVDNPMLACFCGILVTAEPYRFEDGGKLSRASLRMIYALMSNGVEAPYSQIFVSAQIDSVRFFLREENISGFQEDFDDGLAVFSHTKNPARKYESAAYSIGGKKQQINQINDKRDFETDDSYVDNLVRMRCSDGYSSDTDC